MPDSSLIRYPIIHLENLKIATDHSCISGKAKVYSVSYDAELNPTNHDLILEKEFSIQNTYSRNFHELLKLYSENLIVEYFISEGKTNFVYDYQTRSFEVREDNDSAFPGNLGGYYYLTDTEKAEELKDGN